ncbi:predicted protein [Naegleria gruberi]|uniref:Predicted protein n=1 Tax=Naegleria gruberi TaxID=5762 RepID=D2W103_NAEGR|nr:uncharacterized protein NAEGRDRAFT_59806 [Naegleria gruberi]EFC37272.1 predicted protein [Naegleria gruberi]|eukprot:XP_002670016.1 predicted protein [Naegleria gruberi strain NEG-M]
MFGKKKAQRDPTSYGDHDNENQDAALNNSNDSFRGSSSDGNNNGSSSDSRIPKKTITTVLLGAAALALAVSRYKICQPNQYLVRTGIGITNMSVSKKAVVWPLQKHVYVNMNPKTYTFNLHNMSKEKVEFNLPVTFTIGPIDPNTDKGMEGFIKYCQKITEATPKEIETLIAGIIEGETRGLTAKLTVEEMFNSKERFKEEVVASIEKDLNLLGLTIFNANIKEMSDYDERNKYFEYRKQIAIEKANYQSQADVSEAKKEGDVTMELNRRDTRIRMAQLEQEARLSENENAKSVSISNAELEIIKAENLRKSEIAKIESHMAAKERQAELQRSVNTKLKEQQLEFMRSESLSKAIVDAEAQERMADAHFYSERKKAEAIELTLQAQANGLKMIYESCGRNPVLTQFYLGLNSGLYPELAKQSAEAVKGLNPKINIWNTGSDADKNSDSMQSIIKMVQSFAPMLEGIQLQGGVKIPDWLPHSTVNPSSEITEISDKKEE